MEGLQLELGLVVELGCVEEDEQGVGPGGLDRGQEARDGAVVEVDNARFGVGLEGQEF